MHRFGGWVTALLLFALTGCFTSPSARPATWLDRALSPSQLLASDGVILDIVVIEQPLGDTYLNQALWKCTDQGVAGFAHTSVLADNGLRVGQIIGALPERLQFLVSSEKYRFTDRRQMIASGNPTTVEVGPRQAERRFTLCLDGKKTPVQLGLAKPFLIVTPTLTTEGRTKLHFQPMIEHGEIQADIQAAPDLSGWVMEYRRPRESFENLGWDVMLFPNETVVVGALIDDPETLGSQCFVQEDEQAKVQRLLVIRTTRALPIDEEMTPEGNQGSAPPSALLATWSSGYRAGP